MPYAADIVEGLRLLAKDRNISIKELGVAAEDGCILVDGDPPGIVDAGVVAGLKQHGWIYVREDDCWKLYL